MSNYMQCLKFKDIEIDDSFFDSLKADYKEFSDWFLKKGDKKAFILKQDALIQGFLYLKLEEGPINDITPPIHCGKIMKFGTFKINPHGTRLGERFIKKAFDLAIEREIPLIYVTIFSKHETLVNLLKKYGFVEHGIKETQNGTEQVLVKDMTKLNGDILHDYPLISTNVNKYLLSIHPQYHSKMFPDSILHNESFNILQDVSHTNSIHKIYICRFPVERLHRGDIIVIYRTGDKKAPAEYRAVATSIGIVEETKTKYSFRNFNEFYNYTNKYSIFDRKTLKEWYNEDRCYVIKLTYNAALTKRLIRRDLIQKVGINRNQRITLVEINDDQFNKILQLGEVNERLIIN